MRTRMTASLVVLAFMCRGCFVQERLDRLVDEPRLGAPRQISDSHVEPAITMTLESTPRDATH